MNSNRIDAMDEKLSSPAHLAVRAAVHSLPDEEPSLAWRSQLNEKIFAAAHVQKRRRRLINWTLRPAIGLGFAGLLAVMVMWSPIRPVAPSVHSNMEGILIDEHRRSSDLAQLSAIDSFVMDQSDEISPKSDGTTISPDLESEGI